MESSGEYIFFLDVDDSILRSTLSKLYNTASTGNYDLVFCDSAEPKSIADLRLNHQIQAVPAKKGAGTIIEGIKRIKSFKIHLNKKSLNLQNEFQNYSYIEKAGKTIPEDKNNHLIDALRYSLAHYR